MKKPADRSAHNALINILVFPGLGSLRAGRWVAGMGQLILVLSGTALLLVWLYKVLSQYYGLMFGDVKPEPVAWLGVTGGIIFGLAWLWAGVTSISLFHQASKARLVPPRIVPNTSPTLAGSDYQVGLARLPQWQRNGEIISRTFQFQDFLAAMKFVNAVAEIAEAAQHHPDVDIRWNKVTLALTTHDAGGLTEKDFALARQCDGLASDQTA